MNDCAKDEAPGHALPQPWRAIGGRPQAHECLKDKLIKILSQHLITLPAKLPLFSSNDLRHFCASEWIPVQGTPEETLL